MALAILYVEDDELTRQAVAGRLRRRGYEIIEANSGEEALGLASQNPTIAAVLLDIDLPGVNGLETYRQLLQTHPRLPAVVCSAALANGGRKPFLDLGVPDRSLLTKPCAFDRMLAAIESAVHDRPTNSRSG
jgi:CheY-like chemotaxis protein